MEIVRLQPGSKTSHGDDRISIFEMKGLYEWGGRIARGGAAVVGFGQIPYSSREAAEAEAAAWAREQGATRIFIEAPKGEPYEGASNLAE